ncbi:MAG: polysaccharide deacetylase family protein [Patescibacteria group bacterium]|nr:polysaccharide deacetylase family protein [Patescibacteria group bacterium]MDE1944286.1 polysaccharide deacetylase family protein [Patescibacteria group bacterium]MDE1945123.1 polysaccharide deacetylase family protein [Patescibacteria group bacterium]MDE2057633.1 polysaccharide deacetylase family protein [Patescibacteria group bacterium]
MPVRILALIALAAFAGGYGVVRLAHGHVPGAREAAVAQVLLAGAPDVVAEPVATSSEPTAGAPGNVRVPILVYHIVRPSYPSDSAAVRALAVTPETFDAELAHLASAGYRVVPLAALESSLASSTPLPAKPVVITLDDGWEDQYQYAFPILRAHGDPATFFVFTNAIGRKGFFTWSELKEMLAVGMSIGDHTESHPYLTRLSLAKQQQEILGARAILERGLGVSIREFAYPFGLHDATTTAILSAAGFAAARDDGGSPLQSLAKIYTLGSMNAPTTTAAFDRWFP